MSTVPISQPTAKTIAVVDLVAEALKGRLRIPEFQRPLRWQWEDVRRSFDRIVKGYPIGSLLLWIRPASEAHIRLAGLRIHAPRCEDGWWVVDGQQRLTSLASALSDSGLHDERFALAYDLQRESFGHLGTDDEGHIIPLPVLFDLQRSIRWFTKDHPEVAERLDDGSRITRAIREYRVPAYLVSQEDESVLRGIFDPMNNYGKRLSRAEVFAALHPGTGSGLEPAARFQRIGDSLHAERGFRLIDDDTVMQAVLARRGGNLTRDIRAEFSASTRDTRDFGAESEETPYREGEIALSRAVTFLQEDAGVPHFAFLPYRYLFGGLNPVLRTLPRAAAAQPRPSAPLVLASGDDRSGPLRLQLDECHADPDDAHRCQRRKRLGAKALGKPHRSCAAAPAADGVPDQRRCKPDRAVCPLGVGAALPVDRSTL